MLRVDIRHADVMQDGPITNGCEVLHDGVQMWKRNGREVLCSGARSVLDEYGCGAGFNVADGDF